MRLCVCCGADLDPLGKNKKAIYCSTICKQRTLTKKNYDAILKNNREWYKKNREVRLQKCSEYYHNLSEEQKEYKKIQTQESYHRNKNNGKFLVRSARRRTTLLQRHPKWLTEFDLFLIEEIYHLARLQTALLGIPYEVDHILPLQGKTVSGLHVPSNLQIISRFENRSKGNKT